MASIATSPATAAPCLNCGATLTGRYCAECGQSAHVHRTLMSMAHDLLHGAFHFEGKIWRTVPMLVLRPGALTRRYIAGERAKFVSPLALFLFTVFLLFATFESLGPGDFGKGIADGWNAVPDKVEETRAQAAAEVGAAEKERAALVLAHRPTAAIDRRLAHLREDARTLATVRDQVRATPRPDTVKVHSAIGWLDRGLEHAKANPGLTIYKIQGAAYKFSWALIVLSTPLVALLFVWRRRWTWYDHATFVTYSISFMSLLAVVLQVLQAIGGPAWLFIGLLLLVPPVHMFAQLRGAYGLRWYSAAWRTLFLLNAAAMTLVAFALGVIALEVA